MRGSNGDRLSVTGARFDAKNSNSGFQLGLLGSNGTSSYNTNIDDSNDLSNNFNSFGLAASTLPHNKTLPMEPSQSNAIGNIDNSGVGGGGGGTSSNSYNIDNGKSFISPKSLYARNISPTIVGNTATTSSDKYWLKAVPPSGLEDIVVIHVCDESRHATKDFCCKREILVKHMKYFDRFLTENENGYDDIDISVHCDIDIFEWLMAFIHEPNDPPLLDKSIVVSILISSEFLQMDGLVDVCLDHISNNLTDIIKLPIDLSCISEKLVNKLAFVTHPRTLANTKDRKDKILNKLYKRRVELDFSRKSGGRSGARTIAASLTCCRYCGTVYLENYIKSLSCREAPAVIDFRGQLQRRHFPLTAWSLTAYLKTLHAGTMGWDAIYWHVWSACIVFQVENIMISALEVDRYAVENDCIQIRTSYTSLDDDSVVANSDGTVVKKSLTASIGTTAPVGGIGNSAAAKFTLEKVSSESDRLVRLPVSYNYIPESTPNITPSLSVSRPANVLTSEIHQLLQLQMKYIAALQHKKLIETTSKTIVSNAHKVDQLTPFDFSDSLWGDVDRANDEEETNRGRSGERETRESRKQAHSLSKPRHASGDGGEGESNQKYEQRTRSSSTGAFRSHPVSKTKTAFEQPTSSAAGTGVGSKGSSSGGTAAARGVIIDIDTNSDDGIADCLALCRSMPSETFLSWVLKKGPYLGVSLSTNPIELAPNSYSEMITSIQESNISASRKLEWMLDVQREYDEKRLERFESFLISRRTVGESANTVQPLSLNNNLLSPTAQASSSSNTVTPGARPNIKILRTLYHARKRQEEGESAGPSVVRLTKLSGDYYKDRGRHPSRENI